MSPTAVVPAAGVPDESVCQAIMALQRGKVIAYPTEAVYGLGCDPADEAALRRIIDIKGRDACKGFILIASELSQLLPYLARVQPEWRTQFDAVWPGPVTFVVPAAEGISELLTGSRNSVAVRVSDHPIVRQLCDGLGAAIVSTSANRSGEAPCRTSESVLETFSTGGLGGLDVIVAGATGSLGAPTRIVDVVSGVQLR